MRSLQAHFLPDLTTPEALAGGTVVVIDVLRASTVIVHALAAGAREVIPCLEIDDARQVAARLPKGQAILGGERGGLPIEGFDLGNSPGEYTAERVSGKTVVFTTTNGTRAMRQCRQARRVLIGALVNASAIVEAVAAEERVHLLCAGTRGEITREDVLVAGLLADRLLSRLPDSDLPAEMDQARIARDCYRRLTPKAGTEAGAAVDFGLQLRHTQGGRNLTAISLERDIDDAAQIDRFAMVPELDVSRWAIITGGPSESHR
ncbi:MAG TPA: 2-phosphosulfolactate phosphatase [Pirellulales bacterium]